VQTLLFLCDLRIMLSIQVNTYAGDGGNTNDSGPGGGGGFGGGGATDHNGVGGSFSVMGNVGRGGNSTTTLTAVRFIMINSTLNTSGGKGGDGGKGGTKNHTFKQSAGGGGYGGGGGGYSGAYGGGYGNVGGCVGDGGDATTNLIVVKPTISADSEVIAFKGTGGNGSNSSGAGLTGGEGEGRVTSNGNVYLNIPMSISILLSPSNNSDLNGTSKLKWLALHNSTTNGPLSNYIIQIDDDINFNSLELEKTISATEYILGIPLPKGAYYWRVKANYSTPAGCNLGWSEVWKFWSPGIPAVISITKSPSDVYRSLTIWFYVNAEDDLDLESDLFCEMQYRLPFGAWTNFTNIGYIGTAPTGYWAANLSTDTSSSLGIANFRVRFNDTENNLASWSYETFKILNNLPIAEEISFSENYIFRNQSLTIYFNGSDLENSKSNLICIAQYRSPTGIWEDIDNINYISNHWTTTFKRNISVEIGLYDFRVKFIDLDNDQSLWLVKLDILIVKNNIPLAEDIKYSSLSINRTESITIFVNGSDIEDNENSLHCRVQYRSPSGGWIDIPGEKYVYDHWEVDMTPGINAETGNYDFRVRFSDCENNVSSWLEDFDNVTITNIPPEPQDLSYSSSKVFRTNSITIYSNGIDIETSEHLLECIIQYRSPSNDWTDLPGETYNLNRWEVVFTTAKDTELGTYDFRVSYIDEDNNQSSWLEDFDLITVLNNNPKINTENVIIAYEDKFYTVNYKASDIETEILIWTYASNAPWLKWDSENHTIYGTPTNDDVGSYWVTINISDDQEGYDESNFTLTVVNVNDAPSIITQDKKITYEDEEYKVIYTASDIEGDNIKWAVTINGAWLNWGPQNHTLYGVPNNNDNGNYWIRINISDGNGGYDEHVFLLTVVNVNDPPTITGAPTNIELDAFTDKIIDFSPYITDVDNSTSDLKLIINSDYAKTDGLTVTFNYPSSVPSEEVEVTVSDGIDISKPHYIIITVLGDKTNPKIVDWLPIGTKVALNSNISIVFNELMDISNVEKAFSIVPIVNGNFVWYSKTMVFDPTTDLDYNITYKIYIATSATDLAGNNLLKHFTWEFTTVQKPEDDPGPHIKPNESNDNDDDGYLNVWEEVLGTDPDDPNDKPIDTDKDGMPDGDKMNTFSWMDPDDDNDGLVDDAETFEGTDTLNPDTDGDGFNDFIDKYPLDSDKWEKEVIVDDPEEENPWLGILIVAIIIIIIIVILLFIFIIKPKLDSKKSDQSDSEQKPGSFTPPQPPNIGQPPGPQIPPPYQPPQF